MTAGTTATADASSVASHAIDPKLPYTPRKLTRGERNRREVLVFFSPRNQRIVTIADAVNSAVALKFEFDPNIKRYIERPRRIQLTAKQQIDVSFWTRDASGEERFYLVVPETGTVGSTTSFSSLTAAYCQRMRTSSGAAAGSSILYENDFIITSGLFQGDAPPSRRASPSCLISPPA